METPQESDDLTNCDDYPTSPDPTIKTIPVAGGVKVSTEVNANHYGGGGGAGTDFDDDDEPKGPVIVSIHPPRFDSTDTAGINAYLDQHGYVVIGGALSADAVTEATDLFWDWLTNGDEDGRHYSERESRPPGPTTSPVRGDPSTWETDRWASRVSMYDKGIINSHGIGSSAFLWHVRTQPAVKRAFSAIWKTDDLLTSFDGANAFRPWTGKSEWKTDSGWYHVDQGKSKPNKCCIQGVVCITAATEHTGGLVVIPGSHHDFPSLMSRTLKAFGDYVSIRPNDPILNKGPAALICAESGDLVLWDSRTIHCNSPGLTPDPNPTNPCELVRIAAYVCMTPTKWASTATIVRRREVFIGKGTTSHWPHEIFGGRDVLVDLRGRSGALEAAPPDVIALVDGGPSWLKSARNVAIKMFYSSETEKS